MIRPTGVLALSSAIAVLALASVSPSAAQQRGTPQRPAQPAAAPAQPEQPKASLIYSKWTKVCTEDSDAKPTERKRVCMTGKEARLESGLPAASVVLIERDKDKKVLRVLLPLGMQIPPGARIAIDQGRPVPGAYAICLEEGCVAEYEVSGDMLNRLKKGKQLAVQAITGDGQAISVNLPLDEFAKTHDGKPADPAAFEDEQRRRAEDMQRRINEARALVEQARAQPGSQGGSPSGPQAR
jgi:invasion protein IalB